MESGDELPNSKGRWWHRPQLLPNSSIKRPGVPLFLANRARLFRINRWTSLNRAQAELLWRKYRFDSGIPSLLNVKSGLF